MRKSLKKILTYKKELALRSDIGLIAAVTSEDIDKRIAAATIALERTNKIELYEEQIYCAKMLLNNGCCEMSTGEGKTLAIAIAALAAVKPVHVATVSDFIAVRDYTMITMAAKALSITVGVSTEHCADKESIYSNNIVYTSARTHVFDSFREIESFRYNLAILDEIDFVLIDNAVSSFGMSEKEDRENCTINEFEKLYSMFNDIVDKLNPLQEDKQIINNRPYSFLEGVIDFTYNIEHGQAVLTDYGISKICTSTHGTPSPICRFVTESLIQAKFVLTKNEDYIIDKKTNRIVWINKANGTQTENSVREFYTQFAVEFINSCDHSGIQHFDKYTTYQEFYSKFNMVCGTSGTVKECADELSTCYGMTYTRIPNHFESLRIDNEYVVLEDIKCISRYIESLQPCKCLVICQSEKLALSMHTMLKTVSNVSLILSSTISNINMDEMFLSDFVISTILLGRGIDIDITQELSVVIVGNIFSSRVIRQIVGRTGRQGKAGQTFKVTCNELIFKEFGKKLPLRRLKEKSRDLLETEKLHRIATFTSIRLYNSAISMFNAIRVEMDTPLLQKICELSKNNFNNCYLQIQCKLGTPIIESAELKLELMIKLMGLTSLEKSELITKFYQIILDYVTLQ